MQLLNLHYFNFNCHYLPFCNGHLLTHLNCHVHLGIFKQDYFPITLRHILIYKETFSCN